MVQPLDFLVFEIGGRLVTHNPVTKVTKYSSRRQRLWHTTNIAAGELLFSFRCHLVWQCSLPHLLLNMSNWMPCFSRFRRAPTWDAWCMRAFLDGRQTLQEYSLNVWFDLVLTHALGVVPLNCIRYDCVCSKIRRGVVVTKHVSPT